MFKFTRKAPSARIHFRAALLLTLTGLADSIYLSISHYRNYSDITYRSFCALTRTVNCDTVSQSVHSIFLGLPVPLWGVLGYFLFLALLLLSRPSSKKGAPVWSLLFILSLFFSLYSVFLGAVSAYLVRSYCLMCIVSFAVNFALFFITFRMAGRNPTQRFPVQIGQDLKTLSRQPKGALAAIGLMFGLCLGGFYNQIPPYWELGSVVPDKELSSGETEEGYPWIGAEKPELTISVFSDYLCFQCYKMDQFLLDLVNQYPDELRLVHRNFPMDHLYNPLVTQPFHTGSGDLAMIALYAHLKGKFWEANTLLFELGRKKEDFQVTVIAEALNLDPREMAAALNHEWFRRRLKHDIAVGLDLGVKGTPAFVIDEQLYESNIPVDVLKKITDDP